MVKILASESQDNRKALDSLEHGFQGQRDEINELVSRNCQLVESMDNLKQEVEHLNELKIALKAQSAVVEELTTRFETHKADMHAFVEKTNKTFLQGDTKILDIEFQLKTLKDYVDHFGDNLVLASCQITVEASAGFSSRPISLLDVLKQCNGSLFDLDKSITTHTGLIEQNTADILTKADAGICFEVENLSTRTKAIEKHLKNEEEQGVNAIRKMCEELVISVEGILSDLTDKVDRANVEVIVHKKYEDIVQFLSEALKASAADEENFKQKANELIEAMAKLNNSKADRIEITPLQESIVKTEAMLTKLLSQNKIRESQDKSQKEAYSRNEIDTLLELKVNKDDFEQQIQMLLKGAKKKNKLNAITGGVTDLTEDIAYSTQLPVPNTLVPGGLPLLSQSINGAPYSNPLLMSNSNSLPILQNNSILNNNMNININNTNFNINKNKPGGPSYISNQQQQLLLQQQQYAQQRQYAQQLQQQQQQINYNNNKLNNQKVNNSLSQQYSEHTIPQVTDINNNLMVKDGELDISGLEDAIELQKVSIGDNSIAIGADGMPTYSPPQNINNISETLSKRMIPPNTNQFNNGVQIITGAPLTGTGVNINKQPHAAANNIMSFPSNNPAYVGTFRQASENGVAGGLNITGTPAPLTMETRNGILPINNNNNEEIMDSTG